MAVDTYTYGEVVGIGRLVGYLPGVEDRLFSEATVPSTTNVELLLDTVATEIQSYLAKNGYPVDPAATVEADAPRAFAFLRATNEIGAAALLLQTFPYEADPDSESRPNWDKLYRQRLDLIDDKALDNLGLTASVSQSSNLRSGSWKDGDGNVKKPLFERAQFDYPSSRTLTEEA